MLELYIGNKNYSSWSMRVWVLMRQFEIEFVEKYVRFDSFDSNSAFKRIMAAVTPAGKVPVLVEDELVIWDSLAIAEYLAEKFPDRHLWPEQVGLRARARSLSAQMHSGFAELRSACPMNIEADLRHIGALIWRDKPAVRQDIEQLEAVWALALDVSEGPYLFGDFSIADAFYAPLCMRVLNYGLPMSARSMQYIEQICQTQAVNQWMTHAAAEQDFRAFEEPYRLQR